MVIMIREMDAVLLEQLKQVGTAPGTAAPQSQFALTNEETAKSLLPWEPPTETMEILIPETDAVPLDQSRQAGTAHLVTPQLQAHEVKHEEMG